jgi:hypothetical protein
LKAYLQKNQGQIAIHFEELPDQSEGEKKKQLRDLMDKKRAALLHMAQVKGVNQCCFAVKLHAGFDLLFVDRTP